MQSFHRRKRFYHIFLQSILLGFTYFFSSFLYQLTISGRENTRQLKAGPLLIIANHKSSLDPLLIGRALGFYSPFLPLRFMAKDELFTNPFSRMLYRMLGTYPAYKGQGMDKSLAEPLRILQEGGTVILFPEGKRVHGDGFGEPKVGAAVLASKFPYVPILPIAIRGSNNASHFIWPRKKAKIEITIGRAFYFNEIQHNNSPKIAIQNFMDTVARLYGKIDSVKK